MNYLIVSKDNEQSHPLYDSEAMQTLYNIL